MKYFIFILFSFCFSDIFKGEISDIQGNPIVNANVFLINNSMGVASDKDGMFIFNNLTLESDILKITHIAYDDFTINVDISKDTFIKISLINRSIDYNPIVVTSTRSERHIKDVPM